MTVTVLQVATEFVFWACVAGLVYSYAFYPIFIWVLARVFGRPPLPPTDVADADLPSVSLLIAAYNEQTVIAKRIENALSLDYPHSKLEVVIASDGSSDDTNAIVKANTDRRVRLFAYPVRQGKAEVLNAAFRDLR